MKKILLALLLAASVALTLTACGARSDPESSESSSVSESASSETSSETSESVPESSEESESSEEAEASQETESSEEAGESESASEVASEESSAPSGDSGIARFDPTGYDDEAPDPIDLSTLDISTVDGNRFTAADLASYDLTMVNVWATWCGPCVAELPELADIYKNYKDKGVGMLGVQVDEDVEGALALIQENGMEYPVVQVEPQGGVLADLTYNFQYIPTTFFVDAEGKLVGGLYVGGRSYEDWAAVIDSVLATRY